MDARSKRTLTLNLTQAEMETLEAIASAKELSKTAILRQALRVYQLMLVRIDNGEKLYFEDKNKAKAELMVL